MAQPSQVRTYIPAESVVFLKTNERFGGLSNMAPGFPLVVNGVRIRTSEALYQACRFPSRPDVQRQIIDDPSPMTAKMRSKPFRGDTRPDWDAVRVKIMRWCLRVKLAQNWREFGRLLLATGDRSIVEQSRKDDFWGAMVAEDRTLVGMNVLGRLLMELREQLKGDEAESLRFIEPLLIPEFLLFGQPIEAVQAPPNAEIPGWPPRRSSETVAPTPPPSDPQPSLFEQPMIADAKPAPAIPAAKDNKRQGTPVRFPQCRDSGLPWLGEIPEHWEVHRNGRLFAERVETGFEDLPILEVSLRTGVRVRDMENGARKQQMADRSKYKRAAKGDIAYNMMRMWQGAVGVAPVDGLISPAYVVARPFAEVDPRYYSYLFRTPGYMREVNKFSRGIVSDRNRLYWDEFKQMPSAFPPTEEQGQIADFLDAHGRLTARLIRNKRRLIGLLNEQKQAIINRAVTRGLNPDAPMKPTGIDWMPEIPAHWDVVPLKRVCVLHRGYDLPDDKRIEGPFPVVSSAGVIGTHQKAMARGPGVATGRYGSTGKLFYIEEDFWPHNTALYVCEFNSNIPRYVFFMLHAIRYEEHSDKSAVPGIDRKDLHDIRVARVPRDEQQSLVSAIDDKLVELTQAAEKVQSEIRLLNEYRERLIADVVTGKLDVRHIEITPPADEPISDDDDAPEEDLEADDADVMEGGDADE